MIMKLYLTNVLICYVTIFYISVEFIDESQMVFIDNSNGEESIELVNHSMESSSEVSAERKDIVEVMLFILPFSAF